MTDRTERVYAFLVEYRRVYGGAPTYKEIAAACGLSTTSLVRYYLDDLERQGKIKRRPNVARGVVLIGGDL